MNPADKLRILTGWTYILLLPTLQHTPILHQLNISSVKLVFLYTSTGSAADRQSSLFTLISCAYMQGVFKGGGGVQKVETPKFSDFVFK